MFLTGSGVGHDTWPVLVLAESNSGSKNCRDTGANCLLLMAGDGLIGTFVDVGTDDGGIAQVVGRDDGTDCCTGTGVEGCQVVGRDDGADCCTGTGVEGCQVVGRDDGADCCTGTGVETASYAATGKVEIENGPATDAVAA